MAQTVANSWPVSLAQFVSVDAACMLYGLDLVYTPLFFILISPRFQFFLFFFNFFNLIFVYHNLLDSPRRKKVREKNSHQLPECLFSIVPAASLLSSQFSFKTRTTDQSRVLLINSIFLRINSNQNKSKQIIEFKEFDEFRIQLQSSVTSVTSVTGILGILSRL